MSNKTRQFIVNLVLNATFVAFIGGLWLVWNLVSGLPIFNN